jgi:hypothetical protein
MFFWKTLQDFFIGKTLAHLIFIIASVAKQSLASKGLLARTSSQ